MVSLDIGAELIFGELVTIELAGIQALARPWVFSSSAAGLNIST